MPGKREVAQQVLTRLVAAERTNDLAIVDTAGLVAGLIEARLAVEAAINFGHEAIDIVASTFSAQIDSRRQFVAAHAALAEIKDAIGLREVALGGGGRKKVEEFIFGAELTVVEKATA